MGIIVRPTKPSSASTDYINGPIIDANEVNSDFNTIYAEFNGKITSANIDPAAGILGSQLADSPSGITTTKLNDLQVTNVKIANATILAGKIKTKVFDWTPGGSLIGNNVAVQATGFFSTDSLPLSIEVLRAGAPSGGSMTNSIGSIIISLEKNTSDNQYYIIISAPTGTITLTGITFRLNAISLT